MHESDKQETQLSDILDKMDQLLDAQMSVFVQMSRLYDVMSATATGATEEDIVDMLNSHKAGRIFTPAPVLKEFGAGEEDDED